MNDANGFINEINGITVDNKSILISWVGQAGYVLKTPGDTIVLIDPYLSNSIEKYEGRPARRMWFNRLKYDSVKPDLVLCSHDHLDHTDPETLPVIYAHSNAQFWGPNTSYEHMTKMKMQEERLKNLTIAQEYSFNDLVIKTTFAKHTEDSLGFIIKVGDITIYFTGDTSLDERLFQIDEEIDIMISCINGKYGNLTIKEALLLANKLNVKKIIPMHYGLIPTNTVDVNDFSNLCSNKDLEVILEPEINYLIKKEDSIIVNKVI